MYEQILAGADVVLPGGSTAIDLAINDGRIAALLPRGADAIAQNRADLTGLTIFPGAIDVHLHLGHGTDISRPRVPSDAASESAAALMGGVTSFIPYVMSADPYETFFDELVDVTSQGSLVDFGFHFIIATEVQLAGIPHYARDLGVPTAKLFMNIRGDEGKRLGLPGIDDGFMFRLLRSLAEVGGMMCPHPENIEIAWVLGKELRDSDPGGKGGLATWNATRPPFVEAEAIRRAAYLGKVTGTPVYCVHTSSREALAAAVSMRAEGCPVHIETCNHYLTHDVESPLGTVGKINPPLRTRDDCDALWEGISNGSIDTIATDHVHRPRSSKNGDIWTASPGCPGLDTFLPVLLNEGYHCRGIPLHRIAALTSTNPARIMGLDHCKGSIVEGLDADLAVVDLNGEYIVGRENTATDAGYSIYDGMRLKGRVVHAYSRGVRVLDNGRPRTEHIGRGRFLPRQLAKKA